MAFDDPPPAGRVIALKRIVDPSDPNPLQPTNYVDVPTIVSIRIMDGYIPQTMIRSYFSIDGNDIRQVKVHTVKNQTTSDGASIQTDDNNKLDVERVLMCQHVNADWIEWHYFNNGDPAPLPAPIDPAYDPALGHVKSHVVRYNKDNINDPNSTPWIDVELADVVRIIGNRKERESDAAQVAIVSLNNDGGDNTFSDPSDPFNPAWADINHYQTQNWGYAGIMPLDTNGNPDPVRLDPFTNIVNVDWGVTNYTVSLQISAQNGPSNQLPSLTATLVTTGPPFPVNMLTPEPPVQTTQQISYGEEQRVSFFNNKGTGLFSASVQATSRFALGPPYADSFFGTSVQYQGTGSFQNVVELTLQLATDSTNTIQSGVDALLATAKGTVTAHLDGPVGNASGAYKATFTLDKLLIALERVS